MRLEGGYIGKYFFLLIMILSGAFLAYPVSGLNSTTDQGGNLALEIWDLSDSQLVYPNYTKIFANLSIFSSGLPVNDSSCNLSYLFYDHWQHLGKMRYNPTSKLYESIADNGYLPGHISTMPVGRIYPFKVSCGAINVTDRINISSYGTSLSESHETSTSAGDLVLFRVNYSSSFDFDGKGGKEIGRILWNFIGGVFTGAASFDYSNGGRMDSILTFDHSKRNRTLLSSQGDKIWSLYDYDDYTYEYMFVRSGDFDNDSFVDEAAYANNGNDLFFIDKDGSVVLREVKENAVEELIVYPLDEDGLYDDIAFLLDTKLQVYSYNRGGYSLRWNLSGFNNNYAAIGDFDRDGFEDDLAVSSQYDSKGMKVYDNTGSQIFNVTDIGSAYAIGAGDLDHDGFNDDLIVMDSSVLRAYSFDGLGAYEDEWNSRDFGDVGRSVLVADLDEDGFRDEIILGVNDSLYLLNRSGGVSFLARNVGAVYSLLVADINSDGVNEIIEGGEDGVVRIFTNALDLLYSYDTGGQVGVVWSVDEAMLAQDVNNDGIKEIIATSKAGSISAIADAICYIRFNQTDFPMSWNTSSRLWEFKRRFSEEGNYSFNVNCSKGGYQSQSLSGSVGIIQDRRPPLINVTSPENKTIVGGIVNISSTFFDGGSIKNISLFSNWTNGWRRDETLDLGILGGIRGAHANNSFIKALGSGHYKFAIEACDFEGNCNISENRTFYADNTGPEILVHAPSAGFVDNDSYYVYFNYSVEDVSAIDECSIYIDRILNGTDDDIKQNLVEVWMNTPKQHNKSNVFVRKLGYGVNVRWSLNWSLSCTDEWNNTAASEDRTLIMDVPNQPPEVTLNIFYQKGGNISIGCSLVDDNGLSNLALYHNFTGGWHSNQTASLNGTANEGRWDFENLIPATYEFNCYACDISGKCAWANYMGLDEGNMPLEVDSLGGVTYYVREDGGNLSQCNGLVNREYRGGLNKSCALNHPFWLLKPGGYNFPQGFSLIDGGDRIIIEEGSYEMGVTSPNTEMCGQIGTTACFMGTPPTGKLGRPTRIYGEGWDTGCRNPPELYGVRDSGGILNIINASNIEMRCLDVTDHADCVTHSYHAYLSCTEKYPDSGPFARKGLVANDAENITLVDLDIHGLTTGVYAGRLKNWNVTNVILRGNGIAGWNGDIVGNDSNSGQMYFKNFTVAFAGCIEDYPNISRIKGCWAQNGGGYGDGLGTGATGGDWIFINANFSHSTSDGLDLLYLGRDPDDTYQSVDSSLYVKDSIFSGNAGNQLKVRGDPHVENSIIIANCGFFNDSKYIEEGEWYFADNCRAGGAGIAININKGHNMTLFNSVIYGGGDTLLTGSVKYEGRYLSTEVPEQIISRNNIFVGDVDFRQRDLSGLYWSSDNGTGIVPFNNDYSIIYGTKHYNYGDCNDDTKGVNGICGDPLFINESVYDLRLRNISPALDSGLDVGVVLSGYAIPSHDVLGRNRPNDAGVDMGPYEYYDSDISELSCAAKGGTNCCGQNEICVGVDLGIASDCLSICCLGTCRNDSVCSSGADHDHNGDINASEFIDWIWLWKHGLVRMDSLISSMHEWKHGC